MQGFSFGGAPTATSTAAATPFAGFGVAKTTAPTLNLTSGFGLNKTTASTGLLATPATTSTAGFGGATGFGQTAATETTGATGLGGFSGFGKPATTSAAPSIGGFGSSLLGTAPSSTTSTGLGAGLGGLGGLGTGLGGTTTGLGGGLFGNTAASSAAGSIFTSAPASTAAASGLGGLDPNTALTKGSGGSSGNANEGKMLKESTLPPELAATVEAFQKYVKEEKSVREDIARISSKPMLKVQEEVAALRQLLTVVATKFQRNVCSVEKLKLEMTQNLKNAEMAQRTRDVPPGLQYENTAPTEYFQRLVEDFEERMVTYRQQIDTLDTHLAALHQPSPHSPAEVLALMKKLNETFISLASQLQHVHEAVKAQKEQFLAYRRVFHGDNKNLFSRAAPAPRPTRRPQLSELAGPTPFPASSNSAAQAMALVHARAHAPQGPPVTGLAVGGQPGLSVGGFGSTGLFGAPKPAAGIGIGSSVGSLFSSTVAPGVTGFGFGSPATLGSTSTAAALNLAGTGVGAGGLTAGSPFTLQSPPLRAKRGKR